MINIILQSLGLDLVNINVYAKVYQNIPNSFTSYGYFLLSGDTLHKRIGDKLLHKLSQGSYRAHSESLSVEYLSLHLHNLIRIKIKVTIFYINAYHVYYYILLSKIFQVKKKVSGCI